MPNLTSITGRTRPAAVRQDIAETLRAWLADVDRGEIVGLALCGVRADGTTCTQVCESDNYHTLLAAVTVLQFRMLGESRQEFRDA